MKIRKAELKRTIQEEMAQLISELEMSEVPPAEPGGEETMQGPLAGFNPVRDLGRALSTSGERTQRPGEPIKRRYRRGSREPDVAPPTRPTPAPESRPEPAGNRKTLRPREEPRPTARPEVSPSPRMRTAWIAAEGEVDRLLNELFYKK